MQFDTLKDDHELVDIIWNEFLKIVREEAGNQVVETWFKAVKLANWNQSTLTATLETPNQFVTRWIKDHYANLIKQHLGRLLCTPNLVLEFYSLKHDGATSVIPASPVTKTTYAPVTTHHHASSLTTRQVYDENLDAKQRFKLAKINEYYTFDSFIVGPSNSLAHAAAVAIGNNPGREYNPLLIYGGTGLGKTHLLHSIGNEVLRKFPEKKVRYETSDKFMGEFIASIRQEKIHTFRQKYEKLDVLLLDDVQFFSNKEQTQEIFFHIFNSLYERKKHIIMSSDTSPHKIEGLQERLKSRMNWGLVVDIHAPELETKIAILHKKAEASNITLSPDAACLIAQAVHSNVRDLEGALTRISALAQFLNKTVTVEIASQVLSSITHNKREAVLLHDVLKAVGKYYDIPLNDIKSKKRSKDIATIRQITFYLMKKLTYSPLQAIGEYVGNRNHSTVIHAIAKVESLIKEDHQMAEKVAAIEHEIVTRNA